MTTYTNEPLRLNQAATGQRLRLAAIDGDHQLIRKLLGMGLRAGSLLTVTQRRGPAVVIACQGARIALGPGLAERIQVALEGEV